MCVKMIFFCETKISKTIFRTSLSDLFSQLPDPKLNMNKKHNFTDIIVISISAGICSAESWDSNEEWLKNGMEDLKPETGQSISANSTVRRFGRPERARFGSSNHSF